jgi:hypothetical protein
MNFLNLFRIIFLVLLNICYIETNQAIQTIEKKSSIQSHFMIGKPRLPIKIKYHLSKRNILLGDEFLLDLHFQSKIKGIIKIQLQPNLGISWLNKQKKMFDVAIENSRSFFSLPPLQLIGLKRGNHYLRLMVQLTTKDKIHYKPFVIGIKIDQEIKIQQNKKKSFEKKEQENIQIMKGIEE